MMTQAMAVKNCCQDQEESKNHNEDISKAIDKVNSAVEKGEIYRLFEVDQKDKVQADI